LAYAKSVDPGNTGNLWRTQNLLIRATPAIFSERKSVGAGLLANAVSQTTNALRQNRIRGQTRSYSRSVQSRQPLAHAKSIDPGNTRNLQRTQICRSRLAGERGEPDNKCVAAISPSRASALLQLFRAIPTAFGVRKIS
jgi:hypothetical protein